MIDKNITNINYSAIIIQNMKERCANRSEMKWVEMDIRNLKFDTSSFDIIIDKGTIDALM